MKIKEILPHVKFIAKTGQSVKPETSCCHKRI